MDKKMEEKRRQEVEPERSYEPPEILSIRQDELLGEAEACYCHTTSPACITVT